MATSSPICAHFRGYFRIARRAELSDDRATPSRTRQIPSDPIALASPLPHRSIKKGRPEAAPIIWTASSTY